MYLFVFSLLFPGNHCLNAQSTSNNKGFPVQPYPDNVERESGDNEFSRGFGNTNHAYSFDWFDSHMHLAWSHYPTRLNKMQVQEVLDRWYHLVGEYHSYRMILLDPYLETMEWARDDPRRNAEIGN